MSSANVQLNWKHVQSWQVQKRTTGTRKPSNAENKTAFPFTAVLTFQDALGQHGGRSNMPLIYGPPFCWDLFPRYSFFILKTLRELYSEFCINKWCSRLNIKAK